jgi:hypothetical protein
MLHRVACLHSPILNNSIGNRPLIFLILLESSIYRAQAAMPITTAAKPLSSAVLPTAAFLVAEAEAEAADLDALALACEAEAEAEAE